MTPPVVLTIAGSDSGGGAGIQADLKTFAALGAYGASVITAITAQNTTGVTAIHPVPAEIVAAQLDAVLSDLPVAAVKVGMVGDAAVAEVIAARANELPHLVVDPVLVATSGATLGNAAFVERLIAYAEVLTPNRSEARALARLLARREARPEARLPTRPEARSEVRREAQPEARLPARPEARLGTRPEARREAWPEARREAWPEARREAWPEGRREARPDAGSPAADAEVLTAWGARAVVVTGSELAVDVLRHGGVTETLAGEPVATVNNHGSGCTFSSAIAVRLAAGDAVPEAVRAAKAYVVKALRGGSEWRLGAGPGPLDHFA